MINQINEFIDRSWKTIRRFKNQQDGVVAMEYGVILTMLCIIIVAAFGENGVFKELFYSVWDIISNQVTAKLN